MFLCKIQQVIIGFDAMEMLNEMESLGTSEIDFRVVEIEDDDSELKMGAMRMTMTMMRFGFLFSPFLLLGFSFKMQNYLNIFSGCIYLPCL